MKSLTQFIAESTFSSFGSLDRGDIVYVGIGKSKNDFDIHEITVKSANLRSNRSGLQYVNLIFNEPISEKIDKTRIKITATRSIDVVKKNTDGTITVLGTTKKDIEKYFENL